MNRSLILPPLLLLTLVSCSSRQKRTIDGKAFKGPDYAISNPFKWQKKNDSEGADMVLLSPKEGPGDLFLESVNVTLENIPSPMSEREYLDLTAQNLERDLEIQKPIAYARTRVGDLFAHKAHIVHRTGANDLAMDSYIFVKGSSAYVVTCGAMVSTYAAYRDRFDGVLSTFRIKEPAPTPGNGTNDAVGSTP